MTHQTIAAAIICCILATSASAITLEFHLLTWDDSQADAQRPSAVGLKPAQSSQTCDWFLFTEDDYAYASGWNPFGSLSHNIADPAGQGGSAFVMAPSLTCAEPFLLDFSPASEATWNVSLIQQAYNGQATPFAVMNQFLVSPGDPATLNPEYGADGLPNAGTWEASATEHWALTYTLDFYLATNTDGNASPLDIDAVFDDCQQTGYLIPATELTEAGLYELELDDPAGWYAADFKAYLLDQIVPRLPEEATALLVTQMQKSHPVFTASDVSISTGSLVGNTTIAYTTDALPPEDECLAGDMNADGQVNGSDLQPFIDAILTHSTLPHDVCAGDFDGSDAVDLGDVQAMIAAVLGE